MLKVRDIAPYVVIATGLCMLLNGLLHVTFILISDAASTYDRNLLRLLMDGHIMITSGVILTLTYKGIKLQQKFAYQIALFTSISLLVYCALIWPFIKIIAAVAINVFNVVVMVLAILAKTTE